jgi:hypothetical protein
MVGSVVPYALSVHAFVDKVGNYAGFASVIAVALLVIMVFVNARESANLRDRAEEAEERLYRLEYHAEQLTRSAAAVQAAQTAEARRSARPAAAPAAAPAATQALTATPAPAIASRPAPAATAVATERRVAPAGVAAPALASATRLIPLSEPAAGNGNGNGNGHAVDPVADDLDTAPAPSTVAAGAPAAANGVDPAITPPPIPAPRLAPRDDGPAVPPPPGLAPRRNYGRPAERSSSRIGKGSLAAALVLIVVIAVAAVIVITHKGSGGGTPRRAADHHTRTSNAPSGRHGTRTTVRVDPTKVTVAVLNGTSTDNLAADISAKLNHVGFQQGETGNYTDQTQTTTTVGYLPGFKPQALAVARALKTGAGSVVRVSTTAREIACAATPTSCPDQVVVTVGADLESQA